MSEVDQTPYAEIDGDRRHRGRSALSSWAGRLRVVAPCATLVVATFGGAAPAAAVSLNPGDILVATANPPAGVIRVDPVTGAQTVVASDGFLRSPVGVAVEADGDVLVVDSDAFGGQGGVIRVDPVNGSQTPVSASGLFIDPWAIALEADGDILIGDLDAFGEGALIRVDPATGAQNLLWMNPSFWNPIGVAVEQNGDILLTVQSAPGGFPSRVIRVDPVTGADTIVASGGLFVQAWGIALDADGEALVADAGAGAVIRVSPSTGGQTIVSSWGQLRAPQGIALEADGNVLVSDPTSSALIRVDPATGAQATLSSGGRLTYPIGIAVVTGANGPPNCSTVTPSPSGLVRAPRYEFKTITLSGATDPDGDALSFHIDAVHQDEPTTGIPGKETFPDAHVAGANQVRVRAERNPPGNGRFYRIAYTVSDGTASCSGIAKVSIARNKHQPAIDDGDTRRWDSFTGAQVSP